MSTSRNATTSHPPGIGLIRDLFERRVPHAVGIYAGASWGLIEFTDAIVVQRMLFSTHYVDLVLWTMPLLLPSVIMLAWFHGKPGRDRDALARTEKIGIPANLVLCGMVVWAFFADKDLGRMTTTVTTTDEEGDVVEREIVKGEFRKSVALFPFDLGPGTGEDDTWLAYAVPPALELDLLADDFFIAKGGILDRNEVFFRDRLNERGFADLRSVPLTLKREVGEEVYAEFLAEGEIDRIGDLYRATIRVHRVDDGSLAGEATHEGTDLPALLDELSVAVQGAVGIPNRGVEDIPVRQRLSDDDMAVEEMFRGYEAAYVKVDFGTAIELTTTATARDPTFTVAQYLLSYYLLLANLREEAVAPIEAAIEHEYRLPERVRLGVKVFYYALLGDLEKLANVSKMWTELSPDDLLALENYKESLEILGDREGVLTTLEAMRDLDPRNGDLLKEIAGVHEELGNDERAVAVLKEYTEDFPEDATGYVALAALQKRVGDYEAARDNLETAILLEPFSAPFAAQLATLELDAGNYAEAWAAYERALEAARTPQQRAQVLMGIARHHLRRGEVLLAVEATEMLLEAASGHTSPLELSNAVDSFLWAVFSAGGQVSDFSAVVETMNDPGTTQLVMMLTMLESAGVEAMSGIYRMLIASLEAEGDDVPDLPNNLRLLGQLAERAGEYGSAAEHYRQAMALDGILDHHRDLGRVLRLAGRMDESEAELTEALRLTPGDPKAHFEIALLLELEDNLDGAVEHLRTALAAWENADENYEPARQARAKLEELRGR